MQAPHKILYDGKTLKKGTDYTVKYLNNTKVGTATVTVTGKGNYTGSVAPLTFKIVVGVTKVHLLLFIISAC